MECMNGNSGSSGEATFLDPDEELQNTGNKKLQQQEGEEEEEEGEEMENKGNTNVSRSGVRLFDVVLRINCIDIFLAVHCFAFLSFRLFLITVVNLIVEFMFIVLY